MTDPIYVIPDIHGHAAKLESDLRRIDQASGPEARVIFLGDLVDRGPDSRRVIDILLDGIGAGKRWIVLRGNHDQMFLSLLEAEEDAWGEACNRLLGDNLGADATLASYGLPVTRRELSRDLIRRSVPRAHRDFLAGLPFAHETRDAIFCHAGIRPGVPLELQNSEDLLWIREPFLSDTRDHGKLIVHGHTPVEWPEHHGNRVALDGGAGWGRELHVAEIRGRDVRLLTGSGHMPLLPKRDFG